MNGDNTKAEIIDQNDVVVSTAGYWEPNPVTRSLSGNYTCSLGKKSSYCTEELWESDYIIFLTFSIYTTFLLENITKSMNSAETLPSIKLYWMCSHQNRIGKFSGVTINTNA